MVKKQITLAKPIPLRLCSGTVVGSLGRFSEHHAPGPRYLKPRVELVCCEDERIVGFDRG